MDHMEVGKRIRSRDASVAVVGLGYVGLPLAVAFGRLFRTVGFDVDMRRVGLLRDGTDPSGETSPEDLRSARLLSVTCDPSAMSGCDVFVVAVPTPVDGHNIPDLSPLVAASRSVGAAMGKGSLVVYESTVYPGCTEDDCVPVLEDASGMSLCCGDFLVGYSPERINPGDRSHTLSNVVKIVSGNSPYALDSVEALYSSVVNAGLYRATSIRVAEAAKVIENAQRDVNIAFVNELALVFGRMGIDTHEVLDAASTKWNFLNFRPGLVGGHCIGVDPYYLAHKAIETGYHPDVILSGRRVNDGMGRHVAGEVVKLMARRRIPVGGSKVSVLGCTFKEDCSDARNSKVFDIVRELESYGCEVIVSDPLADADFVRGHYGVVLSDPPPFEECGAVVVAVAHSGYKGIDFGMPCCRKFALYDVKGILPSGVPDGRL